MQQKYLLFATFCLLSISTLAQITLTPTFQQNTVCDGFGCNYAGPSILINEVMIKPNTGDGSIYDSPQGMSTRSGEWIELYNPNVCQSVDISCYFLGNHSPEGSNNFYGGGYEIPSGTIVPPRGFVVVRGVNAPAVPATLLIQNGGLTIELVINDNSPVCVGGGIRLWFPNAGGWFAFYNENGIPQDAISWNQPDAQALAGNPCNPSGTCTYSGILPSYNDIPPYRKTYIYNNEPTQGQTVRRLPDGGAWAVNTTGVKTYGTCNGVCIPPPVITCNGHASVTPAGGTPPYSYLWNDGQLQTTQTAVGLCGGVYCVTVTDANNLIASACVTVTDFAPTSSIAAFNDVCIGTDPYALTGGTPAGGWYTGAGVNNNYFYPASAGTGPHIIKYWWSTADSCKAVDSTTINVLPQPSAFMPPLPSICMSAAPMPLNTGFPAGGSYSGPGVVGNTFDPSVSGVGTFPITYTLTVAGGCSDSVTVLIAVTPGPTAALPALPGMCITASPLTLNGGIPAGGTYSGTGVIGNTFDPTLSGVGTFTITYTVMDASSCLGSASQSIQVNPAPVVTMNTMSSICQDHPAITLDQGSPAGGTYTGTGVISGIFDPVVSGSGTFPVTYHFTNSFGCTDSMTQSITVFPKPTVTFPALPDLCINNGSFVLNTATPAGGTYSGTGVSGTSFDPVISGAGNFTITYIYQDNNGCSDTMAQAIHVYSPPVVTFGTLSPCCELVTNYMLNTGSPAGGTYSGTGVTGNTFSALVTGQGTFTLTYTFTDSHGCTGSQTQTISVVPTPVVTFSALPLLCIDHAPLWLTQGSPAGGTYTGTGVVDTLFDPAVSGVGVFNITYVYIDASNCFDAAVQTIEVKPLPVVTMGSLTGVCIDNPPVILTGGSPADGTYSGTGVSAATFYPDTSGAGTFTVTYDFIDNFGCESKDSATITINPLPLVFSVVGGGITCAEGDGVVVALDSSQSGIEYQLFIDHQLSGPVATGTGDTLSFGHYSDAGFYTVNASNPLTGCLNNMADSVQIILLPQPVLQLEDSVYLCDEASIELDAGSYPDSLTYEWQDGSKGRFFSATEPGYYWVKVSNAACSTRDSIEVKACIDLLIPNVITPNNDMMNDRFKPKITGDVLDYKVEVFDRWGKLMYQSNDINEGWDGSHFNDGSECSAGTYYYIVTYRVVAYPQSPKDRKQTGAVTIIR
ncbi:MAG: gliding motility-associated C-terminal domain-containing protein [Bacteroidetes bacterium]|nr:gliding motility-associated C-terminal domain-containing protein [Bacteroidota bacterium]